MLEEISNVGSVNPKISKNAALRIVQHLSEKKKKGDLHYVVKRLVTGMESTKLATRTGCYSTLCGLLSIKKVDALDVFDLVQKCLVTSKESTKKERRLIYIARILCTGAILRVSKIGDLVTPANIELLKALLKDIVDLAQKKSTYLLLSTPFLSHILQDNTLTQEAFDNIVWPSISVLLSSNENKNQKVKKKNQSNSDEDEEDENEDEEEDTSNADGNSLSFCCKVQLALDCKNGQYKDDLDCLNDVQKIAKTFSESHIQFGDRFLKSLFKYLASTSPDSIQIFWEAFLNCIKSTQFELLCLSVRIAMECSIPPSSILSRKLLHLLLSVFKQEDRDFKVKSKETILTLLKWEESLNLHKKQKKAMLKTLFSAANPPSLLHEYKFVHPVIRPFFSKLTSKDLETLHGIIVSNLSPEDNEKLGPRMAIVYLQTLGKIAQCPGSSPETKLEIAKRLLSLALGKEQIQIKSKTELSSSDKKDQDSSDDIPAQLKKVALDTLKLILSSTYNPEFITLLTSYIISSKDELTSNEATLEVLKNVKKSLKKGVEDPKLDYIIRAYTVRLLLDEGQVLSGAGDAVQTLLELAKKWRKQGKEGHEEAVEEGGNLTAELMEFFVTTVLPEANPAFHYEGMFNKLLMEGKVAEDAIQVFAESIDVVDLKEGGKDEEEEDDDESDVDEADESEEDGDDEDLEAPKLDPAQIAKLQAQFGVKEGNDTGDGGSDSEESIALDEASEEDLKRMDLALAKVFSVKKSIKEEELGETRALSRTLRLIELYIRRNSKGMPVGSLLILLMPIIHSLQSSLKQQQKGQTVSKKVMVISLLDSLLRVKKFTGCEEVAEGTFASVAEDLWKMTGQKRNSLVRELLELSVIVLTKCFLSKQEELGKKKRSKKEEKRFVELYSKAVEDSKKKLERERKRREKMSKKKGKKEGDNQPKPSDMLRKITPRFVRMALEAFPDWEEGRKAIKQKLDVKLEELEEKMECEESQSLESNKMNKKKGKKGAAKKRKAEDAELESESVLESKAVTLVNRDSSPSKKNKAKRKKNA